MSATIINLPARMLPHRTPAELLAIARRGVAEAQETTSATQRYAGAHLAALRAAAAVLAVRARPVAGGRGPRQTSVWALLIRVAPELSEWAAFFANGAAKRSAAEAGIARVTDAEADAIVVAATRFIDLVDETLSLPGHSLPGHLRPALAA
jgi:hypothetical protein